MMGRNKSGSGVAYTKPHFVRSGTFRRLFRRSLPSLMPPDKCHKWFVLSLAVEPPTIFLAWASRPIFVVALTLADTRLKGVPEIPNCRLYPTGPQLARKCKTQHLRSALSLSTLNGFLMKICHLLVLILWHG